MQLEKAVHAVHGLENLGTMVCKDIQASKVNLDCQDQDHNHNESHNQGHRSNKMFNVIVRGWVPHKEIGEIKFESFVYHTEFTGIHNDPKFLVYNPYLKEFEVVGKHTVEPAVPCTSQNIVTKKKVQAWRDLIEEKQNKNSQSTTA